MTDKKTENKFTIDLGTFADYPDLVKVSSDKLKPVIGRKVIREFVMLPLHIHETQDFSIRPPEEKNMQNSDIATFTIDPKIIHYEYDISTMTFSATPGFNPEQARTSAIDIDSIPKDWRDIERSGNYHNLEQTKNTITNDHKKFKDYYTFVVKGIDDTIIETITFKHDSNDNNITYFFPTNDKYQHADEVEFNASSDNIYNLPYHDIVFNDDYRNHVYLKDNSNRLWNLYRHFENGWEIRLAQKYWNKESDNHKFISISDALLNNENFKYHEISVPLQISFPKYKTTKLSSSGERWDARDTHIRMLEMNAARIIHQEIIDNGTLVPINIEIRHTEENIQSAFNPISERYDARDYQVNMLEQNTKETTQKTLTACVSGDVCQINNSGNTINNLYIGM